MFLSPKNLNYLISLAQTFKIFFLFSSLGILVIHKMNLGWPSNLRFSHCVYCHSFDASVFSFFKFFFYINSKCIFFLFRTFPFIPSWV